MAQSSDVVGLVALHEWGGCWGPGAQVPRASPHGAEGARVGDHIASPTQNVLHLALALASLNWGTRPSVHCARCKACGLAAVKFCCAVCAYKLGVLVGVLVVRLCQPAFDALITL